MNASALLVALYPPAVQEQWGAEIRRDVVEGGVRCWPDTLTGAVRLWLHPGDWPETFTGQTRRVLAVTLFVVTAVTALVLRAQLPPAVTTDLRHPTTSLWLMPVLVGVGLATPFPRLRWNTLRDLAGLALYALKLPAVAFLALFLIAHSGHVEHPTGFVRAALIVCYWGTLIYTAVRVCGFVDRATRIAAIPTTHRLRAAFMLFGTGTALAATQSAVNTVQVGADVGSLIGLLTLGIAAATTIRAGQDLRRPPA